MRLYKLRACTNMCLFISFVLAILLQTSNEYQQMNTSYLFIYKFNEDFKYKMKTSSDMWE